MNEIVDIAPELSGIFDEQAGRYTIAADKLDKWRKSCLEARNEYIDGLIKQANAELASAQTSLEAQKIVLKLKEKYGTETETLKA